MPRTGFRGTRVEIFDRQRTDKRKVRNGAGMPPTVRDDGLQPIAEHATKVIHEWLQGRTPIVVHIVILEASAGGLANAGRRDTL